MINNFYKRLFVVLLAVLQPFIILMVCEDDIISISGSWRTELQPLFIITNILVSSFFYKLKKWKIPAISLFLLTAFSVDVYPMTHNIIAAVFFISSFYSLLKAKRFKYYSIVYLSSLIMGALYGLFSFETWSIVTLCVYHIHLLWYKHKLSLRKNSNRF